jgi:predicted dehydrogenase
MGRQKVDSIPSGCRRVAVAVVGCGYWGPNLIRNFTTCRATEVVAVCDRDPGRLRVGLELSPRARGVADVGEILADDAIEAVAIATPPRTHGPLARAALRSGKHVLIEKPMAVSLAEAEELVDLAERSGLTLMVDHTFLYSPAVRKVKQLIDSGELGQIYYVDSVRINLGLFQNDVNVLWDLAIHDLAIVDYLVGRSPLGVSAFGSSHTGTAIEDVAYLNLDFGDNLLASFHVNWLSPVKIRHLIVGGSKKGLVFNDLDPAEPVKVYDRGIVVEDLAVARRGALVSYRIGDVWSPQVDRTEPLQNVVGHFADCIRSGATPLTDGRAGLRIVRILDLAQRSLQTQGARQVLRECVVLPFGRARKAA